MTKPIDWSDDVVVILRELKRVINERLSADARISIMGQYLGGTWFSPEVYEALDEKLLPALEDVLDAADIDPTPDTLWGDSGGEPPVTSKEIDMAAWQEHLAAHS